ncbi:MAG: hypothetical protein KDA79_13485 [Planctomycetaceae bacterium]|nr:hypothetical protein [Planctomycetaceae bacterium]
MLSRYTMSRRRPADAGPLPEGVRKDTRWRTRHILRPTQQMVEQYLADPDEEAWQEFRGAYRALLKSRFEQDRGPFDELAALAGSRNVYLGCSCPTKQNPDVRHCHTWVALEFMQEQYPAVEVVFPPAGKNAAG